uniref:Ero1-like protein n=1 Tax=Hirondellea gigas TaxID=1518452 RepID=A0A2P2I7H5_9CRUS
MVGINKCSTIVWMACTSCTILLLVLLLLPAPVMPADSWFGKQASARQSSDSNASERCFCELKGLIDDCSCSVESIDSFNNVQVYPILNSLLNRDFFRYWKVDLTKSCPFWPDDSRCAMQYCSVEQCEVPPGIKEPRVAPVREVEEEDCTGEEHLGYLNTTLSAESKAGFEKWAEHDSTQDSGFCEPEDEHAPSSTYVDLLTNPERYTGYQGVSAHRVWHSIYQENCFSANSDSSGSPFSHITDGSAMCLEKRTFYRAVSGLHASINVHLSARYLLQDAKIGFGENVPAIWGHNIQEFQSRFDPAKTGGEGPTRLKNLYFLYLIEIRALAKAGSDLELMEFYTGEPEQDRDVRLAVRRLVKVARSFRHFDESSYFSNGQSSLKEEFRLHFRNITRIMDCVGCDKCKLWGKLQVTGLGTALKILFSGDFEDDSMSNTYDPQLERELKERKPPSQPALKLTRFEVVALINAIGRLSRSIYELEQFRKLIAR